MPPPQPRPNEIELNYGHSRLPRGGQVRRKSHMSHLQPVRDASRSDARGQST
ncbi:hypothetical protein A176_002316 [Myxococcus hansupus]|uniref:Uncharacterized protein n=1 Tax=Pseudomyxococcus hansupus TaxID=1297742 RepID=A0A0H4WRI9_9BACT|nr:hypothetical protein A176_002316 [Myxococcus hansupus]